MLLNDSIFEYFGKRDLYFSDLVEFSKLSKCGSQLVRLLIDSESCMSRLTGGCYPDWQSGGQWKHLSNFYSDLKTACAHNLLEIIIFFNGAPENLDSWQMKELETKKKVERIFNSDGSQRMSNWIEPSFSKQTIMSEITEDIFRELNNRKIFCYATLNDHKKEMVQYLIENKCNALLTSDFELITLVYKYKEYSENLAGLKFYSAEKFKLSTKKEISSYSYDLTTAFEFFNLNTQKMILLSTLITLGQYNFGYLKKNLKTLSKFDFKVINQLV